MRVPLWIVISQWALLLALAILVVLIYRQLAYLLDLSVRVSAPTTGLPLGSQAPSFDYRLVAASHETQRFVGEGVPTLLLFTDPGCRSCLEALEILERTTRAQRGATLRVLAVTDADPRLLVAIEDQLPFEIALVDRDVVRRLYSTLVAPFLYGIDSRGVIRARTELSNEDNVRNALAELSSREINDLELTRHDATVGDFGM